MKVRFGVKYGNNEIDIPSGSSADSAVRSSRGLNNLWTTKVTIYNDIPSDKVNDRRFDRNVIEKCNVQGGIISRADGTVENIVNAITVITRDTDNYMSPTEYR